MSFYFSLIVKNITCVIDQELAKDQRLYPLLPILMLSFLPYSNKNCKISSEEEYFIYMHMNTQMIMSCKHNDLSFSCSGFLHFHLLIQPIPPNAIQDERHRLETLLCRGHALQSFFVLV